MTSRILPRIGWGVQHGTAIQHGVCSLIAGTYDASTLRRLTLRTACLQSESAAPEAGTAAGHQDACGVAANTTTSKTTPTNTAAAPVALQRSMPIAPLVSSVLPEGSSRRALIARQFQRIYTCALSTAARPPPASPLTIYQLPWRLWAAPTGMTATVAVLAAPTGNTVWPCISLMISAADR
jgi:hypothetical protein